MFRIENVGLGLGSYFGEVEDVCGSMFVEVLVFYKVSILFI